MLSLCFFSLRRSLFFTAVSLGIGSLSYYFGKEYYEPFYDKQAIDNFLFFWLPNQIFVFSLGFLLYFLTKNTKCEFLSRRYINKRNALLLISCSLILFILISQLELDKHFSSHPPFVPKHYIVSLIFSFVSYITIISGNKILVNNFAVKLGQVSFSAYVLHFAVIQVFSKSKIIFYTNWQSILWCSLLSLLVLITTFLISSITYKFIEKPFIDLSRLINKSINAQVV